MQSSTVFRALIVLLIAPILVSCGDGPGGLGPPEGLTISLSPTTLTMSPGASVAIAATVRDDTGRVVSGAAILWISSNEDVAAVGVGGTVQALAVGEATITASVESDNSPNSATTDITVVETVVEAP